MYSTKLQFFLQTPSSHNVVSFRQSNFAILLCSLHESSSTAHPPSKHLNGASLETHPLYMGQSSAFTLHEPSTQIYSSSSHTVLMTSLLKVKLYSIFWQSLGLFEQLPRIQ